MNNNEDNTNSNDTGNLMDNLNTMLKNGSLPDGIKNMFHNMNQNTNATSQDSSTQQTDTTKQDTTSSANTNSINPEMLGNIMNMFNNMNSNGNSNNTSSNSSSETPNIDINMLLKMKSIMEKMNSTKDDPRANLLLSLKPYLKESRKDKIEQYIQFFGISKVMEAFIPNGGDKSK